MLICVSGRNVSDEVTQVPGLAPSVSIDPDEMTLEEYRAVSGGALPPEYSLAAAAVGAAILIVTIIIVSSPYDLKSTSLF